MGLDSLLQLAFSKQQQADKCEPSPICARRSTLYMSESVPEANLNPSAFSSAEASTGTIKGLYELCHPFSPMPAAPSSSCQIYLPVYRVRK